MAVVRDLGKSTSQSLTYEAYGLAEDYSQIITNISPDKTPFLSGLSEDSDAVSTGFSWTTEALRPPQMNAHLEKEDYETRKVGSLRGLDNVVQIFHNTGWVSDTQRKAKKIYNQQDEFDRQKTIAFKDHARDIEYALVNGDVKRVGTGTVPALTGGIPYFLKSESIACTLEVSTGIVTTTKHELDTGDFVYFMAETMPAGLTANTIYYVRKDAASPDSKFTIFDSMKGAVENILSDQVKPTTAGVGLKMETQNIVDLGNSAYWTIDDVNAVMQMCYYRGGNPDKLWMSPKNKRRFSSLVTSLSTTQKKVGEKKGSIVADVLETDYGVVTAMPHAWYSDKHIHVMDMEYFETKWFDRTHEVKDLGKKGNYSEFVIEGSVGLKGTQPLASGAILNIKR